MKDLVHEPVETGGQALHRCGRSFPNPAAPLRLAACMLIKAHDEWQVAERRYLSEGSMAQTHPPVPTALALNAQHRQGVSPSPAEKTAKFHPHVEHHAEDLHP